MYRDLECSNGVNKESRSLHSLWWIISTCSIYSRCESGNKLSNYVNGVLAITNSFTPFSINLSDYNKFFYRNLYSTRCDWWGGKIDDLGFWNRVLNQNEIQELLSSDIISSNYTYSWSPNGETTSSITANQLPPLLIQ